MMSSGKNEFLLHFSLTNSQVYYEYSGSMRKCLVKNSKIAFGNLKKTYEKNHDYAMYFEIIISIYFNIAAMV